MQWLNNPWIIGIGGGILSGLFITLFSRYVLGKRENREYLQKLISANQEIIYSMRPGISEGVVPPVEVVEAVINSTARKYGVDVKDLYPPEQFGEELIKEVMDSSFISSSKKADFCQQLGAMKKPTRPLTVETKAVPKEMIDVYEDKIGTLSEYRRRMTTMWSTMAGILTAVMTMLFVFVAKNEILSSRVEILLPTIVAMMAIIITMVVAMSYKEIIKKKREKEIKKFEIDKIIKKDKVIHKSDSSNNAS